MRDTKWAGRVAKHGRKSDNYIGEEYLSFLRTVARKKPRRFPRLGSLVRIKIVGAWLHTENHGTCGAIWKANTEQYLTSGGGGGPLSIESYQKSVPKGLGDSIGKAHRNSVPN